jgi:peptidoglycan hydrolase CwlO-like protein
MSLVSRLGVVLGLDSAEFSAGLGKAESSLNKFGASTLASSLSVAAIGTAFVGAASSAVMFADGINDIAKANDLAVSSVLEFTQALSVSGGHAENASKLLSSLTNKIDEAAGGSQKTRDKFKELGISLKDLGTLSEQDLLEKTIEGLAKIPDSVHRNAMAFDIFGKAIKGVDIIGFNEQMQALKGTAADADKPFSDIGDSLDRLDVLSRKMKTDLAINIAEPLKVATEAISNLYDWLGKINGWMESHTDGFNLWDVLLPMKGAAKLDAKIVEWVAAKRKAMQDDANSGHYTPIDTMVHPDYGNASDPNKRKIEKTPEQIAAAKKLADEYKKQLEALKQQEASLKNQNTDLNELYPTYAKLIQEFEKGGKYARLKGTADETELLNQALKVDQEKQYVEHAKEGAKQAIQTEQRERAAREVAEAEKQSRMKEVAQMAIQQHQVYVAVILGNVHQYSAALDPNNLVAF